MSGVDVEELRTLFLFDGLSDEQLAWLADHGERRTYDVGSAVYREGERSAHLFVLLSGGLRMTRLLDGEEVTVNETAHRGVYSGAVRAYVEDAEAPYGNSIVTTAASAFFALPAEDFRAFMARWFPMAVHLLDGLFIGVRNSEATVRQREHLARLGRLSADLAHELNNPAAAAVRATGQLRERVAGMRAKLGMVAAGEVSADTIKRLVACQEEAVELAAKSREPLGPVEASDLEDVFADRLDELGVVGGYDLAPVFVAAGLPVQWLDRVVADVADDSLEGGLRWLAYALETEALMDEIEEATGRISTMVGAVKQYSSMDSPASQEVDLHVGLDATVVMLGHKLQGVDVVKEYDRTLPRVRAWSAELNQVWTNLIDNAADAMGGGGRLVLRTSLAGDGVLVEVQDDGPGIPADAQPRVFDAFWSTKEAGRGSGLGLETAQRIVERRHQGSLSFTTGPGGTTFAVRLPLPTGGGSP